MKISENWLREWVATAAPLEQIADALTMAGLEVDAIEDAAPALDGVLIGCIQDCRAHPEADRLRLCDVDIGTGEPLTIVCGAPNAVTGAVVPVATVGTRLPDGTKIQSTTIRGTVSSGMLCSARELGLGQDADGLWLLDAQAPVGAALATYLGLPDQVLEIDLTPNRGDCLSVRGVAREVAVAQQLPMASPAVQPARVQTDIVRNVHIDAGDGCAGYAAQCVVDITPGAATPIALQERLRRAGIKQINLPVDISNYIMLELGQPMHAFDGDKLVGDIRVRRAGAGERIVTLDGDDFGLAEHTLVIADDEGPVAIAGMIGGLRTAVDHDTTSVVFESACFAPSAVAGQGRHYKIHTDSLHRFERGVDPALHPLALERASGLLVELGGGQAGPPVQETGQALWVAERRIELSAEHVETLLGQAIEPAQIEAALQALGIELQSEDHGRWIATPPSWRFDLEIEADLIEEVARIYGYDRLETHAQSVAVPRLPAPAVHDQTSIDAVLRQRGYSEAITYSFVAAPLHADLTGEADAVALDNPIADQYTQMRRTLWASLLPCWAYNVRRQQATVRLFERGLRFLPDAAADHDIAQIDSIAGLISGNAEDTHWDRTPRPVDFFDIKGDVEALFAGRPGRLTFRPATHPALHPGRSARIVSNDADVGWLGQIAPRFKKYYKNNEMPYVFEVNSNALETAEPVRAEPVSEQPAVRRDLAVVVAEATPVAALTAAIESVGVATLKTIVIFDVFRGQGLEAGFKSVALSLIFQDKTSTLTDDEIDRIITGVLAALHTQCNARIRGE